MSAISTGLSLFSFGILGVIAGIGLMAIGGATMIMGANEVVSGITGTNYIRDWMGGDLYDGLYLGLNIASSVGTVVGRLGMRAAGTMTVNSRVDPNGQKPYARITRGNNIYNFDSRGNIYWSKHFIDMPNNGTASGAHWHTSMGGDKDHIFSYLKLILKLIVKGGIHGKK